MKKTAAIIAMLLGAGAALANTTLTIDLSNKTVAASATIAIREIVNITLVNIGTSSPADLILRIVRETNAYANAESFTASGTNAVGALDLNTTELVDAYKGLNPTASKQWSIAVWDTSQGSLLVNDFINIQNNPYDESMPGPSPVGVSYVLTTNAAYLNSITGITYRTQGNTGTVEKLDGRNARITFPSPEAATGAVVSVNGNDGVVILSTSDIGEGTNLYHTEARVSANVSVTDALAKATAAYPASNPSNFVDASITNSLYPSSNPSNFVDANVTNDLSTRVDGMTNGAALGATAVQPTDSDYTNAVAGAALGATALQPGAAGTSTNLSEYSNDAGFLTSNLVLSVHGRIGAVVAAAADYAAYYATTNYAVTLSNLFVAHRDATGTNVHGLGTMALEGTGSYYTATAADALLLAKASTSELAAVEAKADQGVTAYLWGPHAEAGYLTSTNTRYNAIDVAAIDSIGTNISGLTNGTYTGVVTSVAFTGAMNIIV
ncbi:MAG: hypothetical protein M0R74_16325, partial [Dehalococcoidia bacterium]|nr:hypothetical protein [Dehalococcoidia bacterium]